VFRESVTNKSEAAKIIGKNEPICTPAPLLIDIYVNIIDKIKNANKDIIKI